MVFWRKGKRKIACCLIAPRRGSKYDSGFQHSKNVLARGRGNRQIPPIKSEPRWAGGRFRVNAGLSFLSQQGDRTPNGYPTPDARGVPKPLPTIWLGDDFGG